MHGKSLLVLVQTFKIDLYLCQSMSAHVMFQAFKQFQMLSIGTIVGDESLELLVDELDF